MHKRSDREITARRLEAERLAVKARERENFDRQQQALRRQKEFREKTQIWNEQILPRWSELFQDSTSQIGFGWSGFIGGTGGLARVRDLCHKGIPPNIRGKVWPLMIKNDLKIDGEMFEHLNRKVIQIYGVNLTANKPLDPEDHVNHAICPVYRDSFLGLFDEAHPLYPRDGSPAPKTLGRLSSKSNVNLAGGKSNSKFTSPSERGRTVSVMKRAQSLSSLVSLVSSDNQQPAFRVGGLSPKQSSRHDSSTVAVVVVENDADSSAPACADVTEEAWFQNERNGSLDQSAFEYVQQQLFAGTEAAESRIARHLSTASTTQESVDLSSLARAAAEAQQQQEIEVNETTQHQHSSSERHVSSIPFSIAHPATPTKPLPSSLAGSPATPKGSYMDSPSLRRYRSKSEDHSSQRTSERDLASASPQPPDKTSTNPINTSMQSCGEGFAQTVYVSPRAQALLDSARKVDAHFFSSSSDEEEDDDDVIPHIIPEGIQSAQSMDDEADDCSAVEEGDPLNDSGCDLMGLQFSSPQCADDTASTAVASSDEGLPPKLSSPIKIDRINSGSHLATPPGRQSPLGRGALTPLSYTPGSDSDCGTPPPRRIHSREYLLQAGLLHSGGEAGGGGGRPAGGGSQSSSRQKPLLLFPPHSDSSCSNGEPGSPHSRLSRIPSNTNNYSPQNSYSNSLNRSYSAAGGPRSPSRDTRSYSRQSMEEILHHALAERDTEGSLLSPSQSRFSFQSRSTSLRLGSVDGATCLLAEGPILVQDDDYFQQPEPTGRPAADLAADEESPLPAPPLVLQPPCLSECPGSPSQSTSTAHNLQLITSMSLIEWDLPRTYPTLGFFHDGGPMHTGLERVLMCYVCYRPDVGYVQGMSYLVATLLLYMDEFEAFKCMANLLGRRLNMDFYKLQKEAIEAYVHCFDFFFEQMLPLLFEHFRQEGVTSEMFLMDWMMSLFTKTLPLEIAAHIWDVYLYEGEMYLMCVALGILKLYAAKLSTFTVEKVSPFLLHLPEDIKPDDLFHCISQIRISRKRYERIRLKMAVQSYGSIEAYQAASAPPAPATFTSSQSAQHSPFGLQDSAPCSGKGLSPPPHIVSSNKSKNSSNSGSAGHNRAGTVDTNGKSPDFWERRRNFRRSLLDSLRRRWLPTGSSNGGNTDSSEQQGNNSSSSSSSGSNSKPRSNSFLFRRPSSNSSSSNTATTK